MTTPATPQPAGAGQDALPAARASRDQHCPCGQPRHDGSDLSPATVARARAYLAAHPGHQLAIDENGTLAVIALRHPGPPEVLATSQCLQELLDRAGAPRPPASGMQASRGQR
jgi:hypothetical protein